MQNKKQYIPYGKQYIDECDIEELISVLRSDWITQGPKIEEFEKNFAEYAGADYAVACANGTAALHLVCLANDIKTGDIVLSSPISFAASMNCALYCGAKPAFADIDANTKCISPDAIEKALSNINDKRNCFPKMIIPVHYCGYPCDMDKIYELAKNIGAIVVEDACHALGAFYKDKNGNAVKIGSCHHSDAAVFSFHPVKHITTGEGGMITTNNKNLYDKMIHFRSHGITKRQTEFTYASFDKAECGMWYYEMQNLGFNYRITDIQCALGISQLKKLPEFLEKRRNIVQLYHNSFRNIDSIDYIKEADTVKSAWHIYPINLKGRLKSKRKKIFEFLRKKQIGVNVHYIPIHLQPYYRKNFGFRKGDFPISENFYDTTITLPLFPSMTEEEVSKVITSVLKVVEIF
ncbi:UDP-4-amino-4,6-dideoxy-N-acetyl-beta-L-altrosamine transaminase [bacterium]|nr:UDP-4-amino-4,6-dideoxy-N-acetyl-beta-L-altrosamine transaminase [bacterium]